MLTRQGNTDTTWLRYYIKIDFGFFGGEFKIGRCRKCENDVIIVWLHGSSGGKKGVFSLSPVLSGSCSNSELYDTSMKGK